MENKEIIEILKEKFRYLYITRDKTILEEQISLLTEIELEILKTKRRYIAEQDEQSANLWLSFGCLVKAIINGLRMFVLLKDGDPDNAWICLIEAQNNASWSIDAHEFNKDIQVGYISFFDGIEKWLFPPQTFLSSSMVVGRSECSICKKDMLDCNHIRGQCYMGEFCYEIATKIERVNHAAIVFHPADKKCRITHTGNTDPPKLNMMTLKMDE